MAKTVTVKKLPKCQFCKDGTLAEYDTRTIMGPWADCCRPHWEQFGVDMLGTGFGQRLILDDGEE